MTEFSMKLVSSLGVLSLSLTCLSCGSDDEATSNAQTPDVSTSAPDSAVETDMGNADEDTRSGSDMASEPDVRPDMAEPIEGEDVIVTNMYAFPPIAETCSEARGAYRIPFVLLTDTGRSATLGDRINGRPLLPNRTMGTETIASYRSRVSELEQDTPCTSSASCSPGFECAVSGIAERLGPNPQESALKYCTRSGDWTFVGDTLRLDVEPSRTEGSNQLISVLISNSGRLLGYLPSSVGNLYDASMQKDLGPNPARAVDPDLNTRDQLQQYFNLLSAAVDPANSLLSVWYFGGESPVSGVRPLFNAQDAERRVDYFTPDFSSAAGELEAIPDPSARLGANNLYQAILQVVDKDLGLEKYADYEKFMVVFTEGPNEVRTSESGFEAVRQALVDRGIRLFIVHLDAAADSSTLRDVPSYWEGTESCSSPSDCRNFESCRPATVYAETAGGAVTTTPESYCLPNYRADGRLGPIDAFSDLACETGGNYIYAASLVDMEYWWNILPHVQDGQWSIAASLGPVGAQSGLSRGFYRMSGVFSTSFANFFMTSEPWTAPRIGNFAPRDTRPVLRVKEAQ